MTNMEQNKADVKNTEGQKPEVKKRKHPVIDQKNCAGCSVCVETCPMDCLQIEPAKYHGDINTIAELVKPERCTGCGLCAKQCPIRAIEMKE